MSARGFGILEIRHECGTRAAFWYAWALLSCKVAGHRWERRSWFESWDVGVGYEEFWWQCCRCEAFSHDDPCAPDVLPGAPKNGSGAGVAGGRGPHT